MGQSQHRDVAALQEQRAGDPPPLERSAAETSPESRPEALKMSEPDQRVWHYHLDAEGHLWHEGTEIDDADLLSRFMKGLETLPDGRFRVFCQGEECLLSPEDTPYVVTGLSISSSRIELVFPGGYREPLDPAT